MYALVKDYLIKNAYTRTLQSIESDYKGQSDFSQTAEDQEETKDLQSLTMRRKMTIDFAEKSDETKNDDRNANGNDNAIKVHKKTKFDEISDASRSQLTMETEFMVPLAATECLQETPRSYQKSAIVEIEAEKDLHEDKVETEINHYVNELLNSCLQNSTQGYMTNLEINQDFTEDEFIDQKDKDQAKNAFCDLQAAEDHGQSLQNRLLVLSRSKSTHVQQHLRDGLLPESDEEDEGLILLAASNLSKRGQLRKLITENKLEKASSMLASFFEKSTAEKYVKYSRVCMVTLMFISHVREKDFAGAVQLLKSDAFKQVGSSVPVWNKKQSKAEMRPLS